MEILVKRKEFFGDTTIGEMYLDGKFFCYTLEDKDRGYGQNTPKIVIQAKKIIGSSAIPYGKYKVIVSLSKKLGRILPLIMDVPLGKGIRIHGHGTNIDWTSGCIIVGFEREGSKKLHLQSTIDAENKLVSILTKIQNKNEDINITIEDTKYGRQS